MNKLSLKKENILNISKWIILLLTFIYAIGINSYRNSFQFFMLPMADTFNADRSLMSSPVSVFMITTGFINFFVGFLVDRFSVRKIMSLGVICVSTSYLILPHLSSIHIFSIFYGVLGGIGYSCSVGVTSQYFISQWFKTQKGLALSILTNANSAGLLLLSPIWAIAPKYLGWEKTYTILGAVLLFVLLPILIIGMKNPPSVQTSSIKKKYNWQGFWVVLKRSKVLRILYLGVFTCGFTMGIIDAHLVPMLEDAKLENVNGLMSSFGAFIIVGGLLSGWISDLIGNRNKMLSILFFIRLLSFLCLLVPIVGLNNSAIWFWCFNILFGLSYTGVVPLTIASISEYFTSSVIGSLIGINFFIHQIAGSVGVYFGGLFFDINHNYLIIVLICLVLVTLSAILELSPAMNKKNIEVSHNTQTV